MRAPFRADVGPWDSKARARPARQVHALVGQHQPARQRSKIVKRGTAHRFSTSRYARMVDRGSPVMVRLRRPRRAGEKVVRPFPMWRVRPPWHPAPPWARGIRRTLWRPTSILYPYSVAGQRPRSAAGRVAHPLRVTVRGDVGRSRGSKGRAARTVCCIALLSGQFILGPLPSWQRSTSLDPGTTGRIGVLGRCWKQRFSGGAPATTPPPGEE